MFKTRKRGNDVSVAGPLNKQSTFTCSSHQYEHSPPDVHDDYDVVTQ